MTAIDGMRQVPSNRAATYERVESALALPMLGLALLIVPLLLVPLAWPTAPHAVRTGFGAVELFIWAAFAVEYVLLFALAVDRRRFFRTHLLELALVVLPMLRPLRIVRSARLLRAVRVGRAATGLGTAMVLSRRRLATSAVLYAPITAGLLVLVAGILTFNAERGVKGANIKTLPDALWWATTTITTVGYGDRYPVTAAGKAVAVVLMLLGIALLGVITASIAAAFIRWTAQPAEVREERAHSHQTVELDSVLDELRALRTEVSRLANAQVASLQE